MEKKSTSPVRIEALHKHHDKTGFDCVTESLNLYLKQLAKQEQQRRTAAVFVLVREDDPQVLGYYTLSQSSVLLSELPASRHKKLPRYPQVPTTLLGRLAVDQSCRGMRYGELLLMNALERAWTASQQVASFAMIVDVLEVEPDPMPFYLRYDFEALPTQPRRLFLPLQVCDQLFAQPPEKKPEPKKISKPASTAPAELKLSLEKITELCFGMKLFDRDGRYMGRICELNREAASVTYLTPREGPHTLALATAHDSCKRGVFLQDASDPAVLQRWKQADDVPANKPGLTFEDGVKLGKQQAKKAAGHVPAPYDWMYEEETPFTLSGDDFNDGYLSGFVPDFRRLLLAQFPPETHKPAPREKTWKETRWGIDPNDPLAAEAFQKGVELADEQTAWLQDLPADRLIDEVFESEYLRKGVRMDMIAFRFGFKSQMEKRFPYRY